MTKFLKNVFRFSLLLAIAGLPRLLAQAAPGEPQSNAASQNANVELGGGSGSPGSSVAVPIYVRPPDGTEIGQLRLQVTFVSVNLKFDKVEPGIIAELGDFGIQTETTTGKNEKGVETTTLTVTATAPAKGNPPTGIPAGLLAYIMLNISEKARPASIGLRTKLEATGQGTHKALANLTVTDSTVEVVAPGSEPDVSCFFFTH
jgi:Cohesin domain